jgi:hypothetical protein
VEIREVAVERIRHLPACSCCRPSGVTRRNVLAATGAIIATNFAPPVAAATAPPSLDEWVRVRPKIANAIVWDFGKGLQPYAA